MSGPPPWAAAVSLAARMPGPMLPVGVMAAAAASTGSMFTTATLTAAGLIGLSISAPAASAGAERFGTRNVLLVSAIVHVLMLVLMVSSVDRLTRGDTLASNATIYTLLLIFTLIAGLSTPAVATFSRAGSWAGEAGISVRHGLRVQGRLDDAALVAAPILLTVLSFSVGPTVGLLSSAVLTAVAVPLYAVERAHLTEAPVESARLPLAGAESAQQLLLEHHGLASAAQTSGSAARRPESAAPTPGAGVPAAESDPGWARGLSTGITLAAALGLVLGGLWISVLDAAQPLSRPSVFALAIGLMAAAGVLCARWRPAGFTDPLTLRRRRLHVLLLVVLSLLMVVLATLLPPGTWTLVTLSGLAVLQSAALGRLIRGLYAGLAISVPTGRLAVATPAVAGGVLLGIALGLTLAGIAADEIGLGAAAAVVTAGSLLAAVVVFSGQLWGSPESRRDTAAVLPRGE
ncbi:hypothetical protein [Nesterenkonia sandarakina]|uniref:MFS transporter n=1 Tax=Nesterenkonia sandarakina TaxID=272918 RepID=A0A7Z0EA73_9MICC|nr:hypothetical protein [Nesterenkonia sandarakina]NYJ17913.1 hypothetical protein [Nesterenkonia sandarakina]